jgi:hypothetical protein
MSYQNQSMLDRVLRVAIGAAMLGAGWTGLAGGVWNVALEVFGWVPLATGLIGWDPIYALLGLNTRARRDRRADSGR